MQVSSSATPNITQASTSQFTIINQVKTITVIPKDFYPIIYFDVEVDVTIIGDDDNYYLGTCNLNLDYNLTTVGSATVNTGKNSFIINLSTLASSAFNTSCDNVTGVSETIVPEKEAFSIQPFTPPSTSNDAFSMIILVTNGNGANETTSNNPAGHTIILTLISDDLIYSGTILDNSELNSTGGVCSFTNLKVLSSGTFYIQVSSKDENVNTTKTSTFNVTNTVLSISISTNIASPTAYFDFSTTITITGADNNNYLGNCNITVTEDTANDLGGALSGLPTNGTIALNMFFKSEGLKKLTASCGGVSGSLNITVLQEKLSISMSSPPPSKSNETFSLTVKVTDDKGNIESTANNPNGHNISLALIPISSAYSGNVIYNNNQSLTTSNGVCTFSNLKILSSGTFYISASSEILDMGTANTTNLTITNTISKIVHLVSISSIATYFSFDIKVDLYGEDNNSFIENATVDLSTSDNSLHGELELNIITGSDTFTVYFSNNAASVITISSKEPYLFSYDIPSPSVHFSVIDLELSSTVIIT